MGQFILLFILMTLGVGVSIASSEVEEDSELVREQKLSERAYDQKMLLKQGELEIEKMRLKEKSKNEARRGQ